MIRALAFLSAVISVAAVPTDLIAGSLLARDWLEVGFTFLTDQSTSTITTRNDEFEGDVVAFISLPQIPGNTFTDGYPAVPKLTGPPTRNMDGTISFTTLIVQANDSFCSREFYTPVAIIPPLQVAWLVVEQGAFEVDGNVFVISTGNITRNNSEPTVTNTNENNVRLFYPTGCFTDETAECQVPSPRAAIQQLQTSVNTVDNGNQLFLTIRTRVVNARFAWWVLVPHDSTDPTYFQIRTPELFGYMIFQTPIDLVCLEGMVFETSQHSISSNAVTVDYIYTYDYPPGVFGMLGTATSIVDSTSLRVFNRTTTEAVFITQEDQCVTEQTEHTTLETAFTIVIGEVSSESSTFVCRVVFNSAVDTEAPTLNPTSSPTLSPTPNPTASPTTSPTASPTNSPTNMPTRNPTASPTPVQTPAPTGECSAADLEVRFTRLP